MYILFSSHYNINNVATKALVSPSNETKATFLFLWIRSTIPERICHCRYSFCSHLTRVLRAGRFSNESEFQGKRVCRKRRKAKD